MADANKIIIGVIGAGKCAKKLREQSYGVGQEIAKAGAILVTGGLKGVMEAASRGAKEAGGTVIGIVPGADKTKANPYCDIVIPTGIGEARNVIVVQTADALISLHGRYGTIIEMCFALKQKKPLVSLVNWDILPEVITKSTPVEAVEEAIRLVRSGQK
ncbi:MAG: TIGR00725 family protein [candidate division Zixibacteria bacterium]